MDNSNKDSLSLEMQLILKHKEHNKKCKDYILKIAEEKILSKEEFHNEKIKLIELIGKKQIQQMPNGQWLEPNGHFYLTTESLITELEKQLK